MFFPFLFRSLVCCCQPHRRSPAPDTHFPAQTTSLNCSTSIIIYTTEWHLMTAVRRRPHPLGNHNCETPCSITSYQHFYSPSPSHNLLYQPDSCSRSHNQAGYHSPAFTTQSSSPSHIIHIPYKISLGLIGPFPFMRSPSMPSILQVFMYHKDII